MSDVRIDGMPEPITMESLTNVDLPIFVQGFQLTNSNAMAVALVDGSGNHITSIGGGTEYTEDVATPNPIVGKAIMMERDDVLSTVTPIEGDWISFRGTKEGALWVQDFNSDGILANTATIAGAVSGSEMQVDVVTSALPTGAATSANQLPDGHNVTIDNASLAVTGTFFQATQPVSAVSLPLPSGASTSANQQTDALTDTELRAAAVVVDLGVNNDVTVSSSALPTGASTLAEQQSQTTHLVTIAGDTTSIDGKTPSLGQSNKVGSVPVTLATDEDNINVDVISGVQLDGLTDTELRASPVVVDLGANNDVTMAVLPDTAAGDLATLSGAVSGTEMQVDIVASLPAGTNNIGDVDVLTTPKSSTGTHSNPTITTSSTSILSSNASRLGLIIKNNSTQTVFLNFGGTAVVTNEPLEAGENHIDSGDSCYTGAINGIVSSSTSDVRVTEFT